MAVLSTSSRVAISMTSFFAPTMRLFFALLLFVTSVLAVVEDLSAAWGAFGYKACLTKSKRKNAPLAACTTFQELLEEAIEQQGMVWL